MSIISVRRVEEISIGYRGHAAHTAGEMRLVLNRDVPSLGSQLDRTALESSLKSVNVLLVQASEQDTYIRDLLNESFHFNFQINQVGSYEEGVDALYNDTEHCLCMVDYHLGNDAGIDLIRKSVANGCDAPFILLADSAADLNAVDCLGTDVYDTVVRQHVGLPELERIVRYLLLVSQQRDELKLLEQKYSSILENIDEFVYVKDPASASFPAGKLRFISARVMDVIGYSETELLANETIWDSITHAEDVGWITDLKWYEEQSEIIKTSAAPHFVTHEVRLIPKNGNDYKWLEHKVVPSFNSDGDLEKFIGVVRDITHYKLSEERLKHDALHDELTGLPNRVLFMDRLEKALQRCKRRKDYQFAVLFIDLDRFKNINDVMGHLVGDRLLTTVAERLSAFLRAADTVARLGGDEFAILLEDISYTHDAVFVSDRLQDLLVKPILVNGAELFTTASIGIALSSGRYSTPDEMLRDADTAMYKAKSDGRARYELFDNDMHSKAVASLQLETDLRKALGNQEFYLCYQPILSLQDHQIHSFEALIRWQHPRSGIISPVDFIPIAEETGLIVPIGYWVLTEACMQMKLWKKRFPDHPLQYMSVNFSARQFVEVDLVERIDSIIEETQIDPSWLKFEITESVVMENAECINAILAQFRSMKIRLSMDDFGTGYSSLSYLHRLPIDTLKIDRSFIGRIQESAPEQTEIVDTIVNLAHKMGLEVVAEGVETETQHNQLKTMKCDFAQGYLFSQPVANAQAEELMRMWLKSSD